MNLEDAVRKVARRRLLLEILTRLNAPEVIINNQKNIITYRIRVIGEINLE